ncbi:MAG: hypothetical protein J7M09_04370, partial [Deltaproteobacteria bacterium]|nr:hypothetical protein [Candidatus Tharpella sp.]
MGLKKTVFAVALATIFVISMGFLTSLQAAEYSADMETCSRGNIVVKGKFFIKGKLSRQEMSQDGRKITIISRPDKGVVWTLMPHGKNYLETAINPDDTDDAIMPD